MVETTERARRVPLAVMLVVGVALCAALLLVVVPGRASADTEEGHSGYVGSHRLPEPGGACSWGLVVSNRNTRVVATAPYVWARSNFTNGQTVGYQAQLFRQDHAGGGYQWISDGPIIYRIAYPNSRANFPNTKWDFGDAGYRMNYKIRIYMYWYYNSGAMMGYTSHFVDYYANANYNSITPYYCRA